MGFGAFLLILGSVFISRDELFSLIFISSLILLYRGSKYQ